ncbi:MAG: glucose-6-phosphate isomerase [Rhodoluna sp.]|nr:glucose-6-phosphate isomerase [Rhodoluna sp.]
MTISVRAFGAANLAVQANINQLVSDKVASRIANKDFTLWGKDAEAESSIRLGWVNSAIDSQALVAEILSLRDDFKAKGVNRFVLCGMGGSSLAPEVITNKYGVELVVLDSTSPDQVRSVVAIDIQRTAIIVSSKSGSTVETDSQKRIFEDAFTKAGIEKTERIVIVTDPGSPMEAAAKADGYKVFNADPTVGGRYSALTAFGLVPSGLAGVNIQELLEQASQAALALAEDSLDNPGLILGAALARSANGSGYKDKLGLLADQSSLPGFGDWIEQLVAESTGKHSKGVLPVVLQAKSYETFADLNDMLLVDISADKNVDLAEGVSVSAPLGAQFMLWEYATVVASRLLGINPFDQPDVESAKIAARGMLEKRAEATKSEHTFDSIEVSALGLDLTGVTGVATALVKLLSELASDGYVSVHAYMDRTAPVNAEALRDGLASVSDRPTTFGWAPRFLHSTGQYHKGGPRQGVFLQLVAKSSEDVAVPGRDFTFGELIASQAAGDAKVLADLGRPVLTLTLNNPVEGFNTVLAAIG